MAVQLERLEFVDPCQGAQDLKKEIIRPTTPQSLIDDPLRILRGFRFALELRFRLHKDFYKLAKNISLKNIAAERIGYEIMRIMSAPSSFEIVLKMNQLGIFKQLFPEAEKLLEDLGDLLTLPTLSDPAKNPFHKCEQINASQIPHKKCQSSTTGKNICGYFYVVDNWFAFTVICATIFHDRLPPVGLCLWLMIVWRLLHLYHKLSLSGGFSIHANRSD